MATHGKKEMKGEMGKKSMSAGTHKAPTRAKAVTKTARGAKATTVAKKTTKVKAAKTAGSNRQPSTNPTEKVRLRTTLSSGRTVDLLKQRIGLHNISQVALNELGDGIAQVLAIRNVLSTLLQAHAQWVWQRKNWAGKMKDDYCYTDLTFPVFLNDVERALRPKYRFPRDDPKFDWAKFDQKQLKGTVDDLVVAIDDVTTSA